MRKCLVLTALVLGCSSSKQATTTPPPPPPSRPAPPSGPTRTDFQDIAKTLVKQCVGGGWIDKWRSTHEDIDVAKPKIHLSEFEDKTGQDLDPTYLMSVLEKRMRMSGVFEMMSGPDGSDFIGRGRLLRLSERTPKGKRFSVYTVTLELLEPASDRVAYSCEATVQGEL
jgi:hypothetical protein